MARPKLPDSAKRSKWPVLNVTPAERAVITAAAAEAGLGVNAYILACTERARIMSPARAIERLRLLGRIERALDALARGVLAPGRPFDAARVLLALHRIETGLHEGGPATDADREGEDDASC